MPEICGYRALRVSRTEKTFLVCYSYYYFTALFQLEKLHTDNRNEEHAQKRKAKLGMSENSSRPFKS